MKVKCRYCKNEATQIRSIDLDLPKFYLCDDDKCFIQFLIDINGIDLGK